jgi:hypothetical protein
MEIPLGGRRRLAALAEAGAPLYAPPMRRLLLVALVLPAHLLLAACTEGGDDLECPDEYSWNESSDNDNGFATDAESINIDWDTRCHRRLYIRGSSDDCGYDNNAGPNEWPWTGDEDNYELTMPADGFLEAILSWDGNSDWDMTIYLTPPSPPTISPDEILAGNGEEEFLFDDGFEAGDRITFGVLCATGGGGDYELELIWEE